MTQELFIKHFVFFVVLFNPFLMAAYLIEVIRELSAKTLLTVLLRASAISCLVFSIFALSGERFFSQIIQARFAAFLIFGGLIFVIISVRCILQGGAALENIRGPVEHLAGAIAMPFMIGPATISASIWVGNELPASLAILVIVSSILTSIGLLMVFKFFHDYVRRRNEKLLERYVEVIGRVAALITGTIAVEMILRGIELVQT